MGLLESGWRSNMGWYSRYKRRRRRESRAQAVTIARAADLARISAAQTKDNEAHDNVEAHIITSPAGTEYTQNSKGVWCKNHSEVEGGNKTYTESYTSSRTFSNGNASVLKLFSTRTIQAGKDVEIYLRVPARDNTSSWGGLYININVKVNSTWYNLGNSGHDGGVMGDSSYDIATSHHHKHLDFIANAGVSDTSSYTVQFEVTCRAYSGTTTVNGSHDMNKTAGNLGSRGALATWGSNQNFTTLIIREVSR